MTTRQMHFKAYK